MKKNTLRGDLHFLLFKLHSLTGIVPIGLFLFFHLAFNTLRTVGVRQYQWGIDLINNMPFLPWIEFSFIIAPLLFHSAMGFYITFTGKMNPFRYPHKRNWLYTLQRITGGVVFLFLIYHVGTTVVPKIMEGKHGFEAAPFLIDIMNQQFGSWLGRILFTVGILSATFHFANGLWGFCVSWGLLIGPRSQAVSGYAFLLLGLVLTVWGLATVFEFSMHPVSVKPTL